MGSVQFGIPRELALALKEKYGLLEFVETGTLVGHTAEWAADHFHCVFTVEASYDHVEEAAKHLSPRRNVWCFLADSAAFLQTAPMARPTLFWLDAHTNESCPVLHEIEAINKSPLRHVILVDDARLFGTLPAWPAPGQVIATLQDGGRRTVSIIEDVIVAEPCP